MIGSREVPMSRTRIPRDEPHAPAARWTFLTNHAHVLILLAQRPDMVLREVAGARRHHRAGGSAHRQ